MPAKKKTATVFIVCIEKYSTPPSFGFLSYNDGRGPIRTYEKNKFDHRILLDGVSDVPYFNNHAEATAWMLGNRGECCQVDTKLYARFGLKKSELSQEVEVHDIQ